MTSTRQIKKRMLRERRYRDHYRAPGLRVGRRAAQRFAGRQVVLGQRRRKRQWAAMRARLEAVSAAWKKIGPALAVSAQRMQATLLGLQRAAMRRDEYVAVR